MKKAILWTSAAVAIVFFLTVSIYAGEKTAPSVEQQLSELLQAQKRIEQRLTAIEQTQRSIMNSLQAPRGPTARPANIPPPEDLSKVYNIDIGRSPIKGEKKAKVTIVEFSDFQCPFSQRFHPIATEVQKLYPSDVNYVLKNFPLRFHPQARPAAKAALAAAQQGKYWEMVELLFQNGQALSEEKYKQLAEQLGLDVEKFMSDYKERDTEWEKWIEEDMKVAEAVDVLGTPTFYINGQKTRARDVESFKAEVEKILTGKEKK